MNIGYGRRLFLYLLALFLLFAGGVAWFQRAGERAHKTRALEERLDAHASIVDALLARHPDDPAALDSLLTLFPPETRLTIIDNAGEVLRDNALPPGAHPGNHADRPEIIAARQTGRGSDIRRSSSNDTEYLYHALRVPAGYTRVALPYDPGVRRLLEPDNIFLYYVAALFLIVLALAGYVAHRFGNAVRRLRDFTHAVDSDTGAAPPPSPRSRDELGEVVAKIDANYRRLKESERTIALEREKLLQHVQGSGEGVCFFSADGPVEFSNDLFIRYLNTIVDEANGDPSLLLADRAFAGVAAFLAARREPRFATRVNKQGKSFDVRVNIFDDNSFEIIINDVTRQEKTRLLKQEMTGNITHELRTPVTAIRGCLETVLARDLEPGKERHFIRSAYNQVLALSELIQDMSLITRIEDAPHSFQLEPVNLPALLRDLRDDLEIALREKRATMSWNMPGDLRVTGNRNLVYSIFRNLADNAIRYAGNDVTIHVTLSREDAGFYHFSFADTGVGIPDERHLNRLFERFYRINEGRTRETGGSGLGLSIVKNAVAFHKGSIIVKNRAGGGLEFLFSLPRAIPGRGTTEDPV